MPRSATKVYSKNQVLKNLIWICWRNGGKDNKNSSIKIAWKQVWSINNSHKIILKCKNHTINHQIRINRTMKISKLVGKNSNLIIQIIQNTLKSKNPSLMRNQRLKLVVLPKNKDISQAKNHKNHKNKDNSKSRREYF